MAKMGSITAHGSLRIQMGTGAAIEMLSFEFPVPVHTRQTDTGVDVTMDTEVVTKRITRIGKAMEAALADES